MSIRENLKLPGSEKPMKADYDPRWGKRINIHTGSVNHGLTETEARMLLDELTIALVELTAQYTFIVHQAGVPDLTRDFDDFTTADSYAMELSKNPDYDDAVILIRVYEGVGEVDSIYYLGEIYRKGKG